MPLAEHLPEELATKLEAPVTLTFERLGAADIAGRARAFGSLVAGGYSAQEAAAVVLLPEPSQKPVDDGFGTAEGNPADKPVDGPADN